MKSISIDLWWDAIPHDPHFLGMSEPTDTAIFLQITETETIFLYSLLVPSIYIIVALVTPKISHQLFIHDIWIEIYGPDVISHDINPLESTVCNFET
jgi:hypothetical protein